MEKYWQIAYGVILAEDTFTDVTRSGREGGLGSQVVGSQLFSYSVIQLFSWWFLGVSGSLQLERNEIFYIYIIYIYIIYI